jgi:hypothetical protein
MATLCAPHPDDGGNLDAIPKLLGVDRRRRQRRALRAYLPRIRDIRLATHGFSADPEFRSRAAHEEAADQIVKPGVYATAARFQITPAEIRGVPR